MSELRPYCLSIAGFDPSAGAGILSDIKTFEGNGCYGLGVASAITAQNDSEFYSVEWQSLVHMQKQMQALNKYAVKVVKIGLVESFNVLVDIIQLVKQIFVKPFIIWDPVLKASAGFEFHNSKHFEANVLKYIDLITPNYMEYQALNLEKVKHENCAVLLKGGHREKQLATDTLFINNATVDIVGEPFTKKSDKHGTGCVLSSAIAAGIARGRDVENACRSGKLYVESFMQSNNTNLGYHML